MVKNYFLSSFHFFSSFLLFLNKNKYINNGITIYHNSVKRFFCLLLCAKVSEETFQFINISGEI